MPAELRVVRGPKKRKILHGTGCPEYIGKRRSTNSNGMDNRQLRRSTIASHRIKTFAAFLLNRTWYTYTTMLLPIVPIRIHAPMKQTAGIKFLALCSLRRHNIRSGLNMCIVCPAELSFPASDITGPCSKLNLQLYSNCVPECFVFFLSQNALCSSCPAMLCAIPVPQCLVPFLSRRTKKAV